MDPLKYASIESERRFLVRSVPPGASRVVEIHDRYLTSTRLRLREMTEADGSVVHKLGHKVRLDGAPRIACTSLYLDDAEWSLLWSLPGRELRKTRHIVEGVAIDEFRDGTLLAEIDGGATPATDVPAWLDVIREVTDDEAWTGAALAR